MAHNYICIQIYTFLKYFYSIVQYFLKNELGQITSKINRGVCQNLFYRQNPPPPATVLCQSPAFKRNNP